MRFLTAICVCVTWASIPTQAIAQQPSGREAIETMRFADVSFDPPVPDEYSIGGVPVLLLEDGTLPLTSVYARFRGGYGLFGREHYAVGTAMPSLLRYGGTSSMAPDSVDGLLEYYAIQTSFGGAGAAVSSTMNTLSEHLPAALELWGSLLVDPAFDENEIEVWRGRQLESIRRRSDDPGRLAFSEYNRLLYGDHPIGWEMEDADLSPTRVAQSRFHELHARIVCRENLVLGVSGDTDWPTVQPLLASLVDRVPACPDSLPASPIPDIRREPGVFLIEKETEQSVIVMAHTTGVHLADEPAYFAATIANSILGAGGFSSRIMARVRTEEGYAYSASSLWTMPRRYDGLLGAITRTRPENTAPAIALILETMQELRDAPPESEEVETAVDQVVNGFVFNFETAGQIVSRTMFYLAQDLPQDWLERYVEGVQGVNANSVHNAFASHLRPEDMMILIVGDSERIGLDALREFGPVTHLEIGENR